MPSDALKNWRQSLRVRRLTNTSFASSGKYVLCWLQQVLRSVDNPVIDAAIVLGNNLQLPVLVYHGVRESYPFASDRFHRFILGASRDLARDCQMRGLACVQYVERSAKRERGLVYRLAQDAAAVVLEDNPTFVARWQAKRFVAKAKVAAFAVEAACVVPPAALEEGIGTTAAFRRRHKILRADWFGWTDEVSEVPAYDGPLPFEPDALGGFDDVELDALMSECAIDHALPPAENFSATRSEVRLRLSRLQNSVLPAYARIRNDASRAEGASALSPYLHFGLVSPREIVAAVMAAGVDDRSREKFLDELLTWREWFHYKARSLPTPESYERVPAWARRELSEHAGDPRPQIETLAALVCGETADETWNACQKQYLLDGWMHNNLRMYWAKRIIAMTSSPEAGWATACYLNDRFSLDGRDPSTYGNIAWAFGDSAPGYVRRPIYGRVAGRSDGAIRKRVGEDWIAHAATRSPLAVDIPEQPPVDPYLTGEDPL